MENLVKLVLAFTCAPVLVGCTKNLILAPFIGVYVHYIKPLKMFVCLYCKFVVNNREQKRGHALRLVLHLRQARDSNILLVKSETQLDINIVYASI